MTYGVMTINPVKDLTTLPSSPADDDRLSSRRGRGTPPERASRDAERLAASLEYPLPDNKSRGKISTCRTRLRVLEVSEHDPVCSPLRYSPLTSGTSVGDGTRQRAFSVVRHPQTGSGTT